MCGLYPLQGTDYIGILFYTVEAGVNIVRVRIGNVSGFYRYCFIVHF